MQGKEPASQKVAFYQPPRAASVDSKPSDTGSERVAWIMRQTRVLLLKPYCPVLCHNSPRQT